MTITIRPINTVEHCQYFQEIERRVWSSEDLDIMPMHVLITVAKNGGVFLGAYASDGPPELAGLVGMTIGWYGIGRDHRTGRQQLKFCSHMAGVLPAWQGQRVGLQLKLAQRQAVLAQGLTDWITWTYDPIYRANAVFNIHRLGAICNTYYPNHYGEMNDALNAGAPSDRCQVDWYLSSEHVLQAIEEKVATPSKPSEAKQRQVLPTGPSGDFRQPLAVQPTFDGSALAVPLPDDITAMRRADQALGLAWRFYLREMLTQAFAAGYTLSDCVQLADQGWHYLLDHQQA
ncbi:MAG: hypothetical protein NT075_36095 [Chloroflexi bacterium]|nr:hypothetical protein [Chloroflexota bacterium]